MSRVPEQPAGRRRVLAGTVVAALLLAGIVGLAEWLRPRAQERPETTELEEQDRDPRVEVECPEPTPREDVPRDGPSTIASPADPVEVSADELLNCPEAFDRRTVRYRGEAIGGLMARRDGTWVQVNDDVYAEAGRVRIRVEYRGENVGLGVFLPDDLGDEITTVGGPQTRGDLVEVVGVFRRVDPATREVTVIRADSAEVVRPGEPLADPPRGRRPLAAALLGLVAVAMVVTERAASRRRRR